MRNLIIISSFYFLSSFGQDSTALNRSHTLSLIQLFCTEIMAEYSLDSSHFNVHSMGDTVILTVMESSDSVVYTYVNSTDIYFTQSVNAQLVGVSVINNVVKIQGCSLIEEFYSYKGSGDILYGLYRQFKLLYLDCFLGRPFKWRSTSGAKPSK